MGFFLLNLIMSSVKDEKMLTFLLSVHMSCSDGKNLCKLCCLTLNKILNIETQADILSVDVNVE